MVTRALIRTTLATAALAAATFTATATIGSQEAEARRLHFHIGHHHGIHRFHYRPYYVAPVVYVAPCAWLYSKARATGSPYWYGRYHSCLR